MAYELMAVDVDGTLVNSHKVITADTLDALIGIQEQGIKVAIASGRSTFGIMPLAKQLQLEKFGGFILSYNGGKITDCKTYETIYSECLPDDMIPELYEFSKKHGLSILVYEKRQIVTESDEDKYVLLDSKASHMAVHKVESFVDYVKFPVNKCLLTGEPEHMKELEPLMREQFKGRASVYRSEEFYLEAMPFGVDKAYGLSKLLRKLGYTRSQLVACGDGYNDVSMIDYAGLGVAMGGAADGVKIHADYVAPHCDEDGLVDVVNRFLKDR